MKCVIKVKNNYIVPGEYRLAEGAIEINVGRKKTKFCVSNIQL